MSEKELFDIYDEVNKLLINNEMGLDLPRVEFNLDVARTLYYADDAKSLLLLKAAFENLIEIDKRSKKID